ncbi:MAG TPA: copper chaperone PCu(A)C [Mycobacteriales bacterium]|nr:copper chaperone PCu(A)C [Mycobacteriales bacterium]
MSPETSIWSRLRGGLAAQPGGRVHPGFFAAAAVLLVGLLGLVYGASDRADQAAAGGAAVPVPATAAASGGAGGATFGDITVRGAYIRQPAVPDLATAYMSITNKGTQPDTLVSAYSGAAKLTGLYNVPAPGVTPTAVPTGHQPSGPYQLAGGATLRLVEGGGHILLSQLTGPLKAGDKVSMVLTFQRTGQVLIEVPVIALTAPTPAGGP